MSSESHKVDVIVSAKDNASSTLNKLSSMGAVGFGALAKVGANAVTAITGGISGFAKSVVTLGQDFSASMSEVSAISGSTGDELAGLEALAREMGATTQFSATQASEGLKYMAMA